ncbi:DEAD/DEAH box helicase family protein [Sphingobacterium sp. LRF_L2]|uniref:DEAD/DEAH box helicase family protein n=1 Tax=Sphingobacterium sp. LRF_L2 TaxID=3369421 RepID=UPI003F5F6424
MKAFPKTIQFKYPWRAYQQRILDNLSTHLEDRHLHIVAPPGSGKTVLGLEVAIRLNKPTLILAPTTAIKNQWIQRFCDLFLQENDKPEWLSTDIRSPAFVTVVTYQGLHAACAKEKETVTQVSSEKGSIGLKSVVNKLKAQNIATLILDEAHHLKNAWWETLFEVKEALKPTVVGLTATPPYDVSVAEWRRYIDLNGPIDEEISVPELVKANDLCLHQDYIHFMLPTSQESKLISLFRENASRIFNELKHDEVLIAAMEQHPYWHSPEAHIDAIYNDMSSYSACLIFLFSNGRELLDTHWDIIGDKDFTVPSFDYSWMERLLTFYLYKENVYFQLFEEHRQQIENRLRRKGILENKRIDFLNNQSVTTSLTNSIRKLDGIKEIVDFEHSQLGNKLRLVILTDYIRKEFFLKNTTNNVELTKLGVLPIFEKLRRENVNQKKIAVLTGSIIIIPLCVQRNFEDLAVQLGVMNSKFTNVPYDRNYLLVELSERFKHQAVHIVTQLFQAGDIEILIGTKSLLGEGWDAPAINALILASFVGSFVLSNQMRGRAIRSQKMNPNKTSNIWHLVCLDPTLPNGGTDMDLLKRKFKTFIGLSFQADSGIENGIGRLGLPLDYRTQEHITAVNTAMFTAASNRENLKKKWDEALLKGVSLVEEIKIPFRERKTYEQTKSLYLNKTIYNLTATLATSVLGYLESILNNIDRISEHVNNRQELYWVLTAIAVGGVILFGRKTYIAFRLYLQYRDISKDIRHIGEALLATLHQAKIIQTDLSVLAIDTHIDADGAIYSHLNGGTTVEKSMFIEAMQEIVESIQNPRYILTRESRLFKWREQIDYHAVPEIIGRNKSTAQYFETQWREKVGPTSLLFTRNLKGRKLLLQARLKSLSAQFEVRSEHVSKWL